MIVRDGYRQCYRLPTWNVVVVQHVQRIAPADLALTIISVEEQLLGWQAALRHARRPDEIARIYDGLPRRCSFFQDSPFYRSRSMQ